MLETKTASSERVRVLLVDDHPMMRRGLSGLISEEPDVVVCGEAGSVRECLEALETTSPGIVIVDISLDGDDGLELIKEIRTRRPDVPVLALSMHDESIYAKRALSAGASGYVMKSQAAETVMHAIRKVVSGGIYLSDRMAERLLQQFAIHKHGAVADDVERLTNRELQILRLLGKGVKVREIAAQLFLSIKTIESHRVNIRKKLGVKNSGELLRYAIQFGRQNG